MQISERRATGDNAVFTGSQRQATNQQVNKCVDIQTLQKRWSRSLGEERPRECAAGGRFAAGGHWAESRFTFHAPVLTSDSSHLLRLGSDSCLSAGCVRALRLRDKSFVCVTAEMEPIWSGSPTCC